LLVAGADLAPALTLEAVQVLVVCGALQGDGVRLIAILNRPLLLITAIALVLHDDTGRATVLLVC
jgi:hypothetical protein